jgi:two-component system, NarL family, sensor histidine kinase BarA
VEMSDQRLVLVRQNLRPVVANVETRLAEVKSRFFSAAAHELRTPLTTIVGYLEMLLDGEFGPLSESQRESLEMVNESARHLRAITNNLLAVAQIEAGRVNLDLQRIDLASLVQTVVDGIQPRLRLKAQRLELRVPSGLPPVLCDFGKAMQVADTLLAGACERTPEGGMIVASVSRAVEKGFLQLTVMDAGPPMNAQEMAEMTKCLSLDGMGLIEADVADLDLYVACSLVELHGGRFWCESAPDRGSSFSVTFPIADGP